MYQVKTRNWNGKKAIANILNFISKKFTANIYRSSDNDNKYVLMTRNPVKAWLCWLCFMSLSKASGGWTYICRPGKAVDMNYKNIY